MGSSNVINDGNNQYLYNADGQICAVEWTYNGMTAMTGYVYDADGNRVAKGNITSMSCDPSTNGFSSETYPVTTNYVRDQAGNQLSEFNGTSSNMTWVHTNVWANGMLMATDDTTETHFYLNDWLGTRRFQTSSVGAEEQTCSSLPYGDAETCGPVPTENLFTGKERDAESGLDNFDARYYSSPMGRFMSPDWSAQEDPVPYAKIENPQTLNLYSYALNNPLTVVDTDGHELKVAAELQQTVSTLREESTSFNAELSAYEGPNAPNLTIQFGATPNDPSGIPSIGNTNVPLDADLVTASDPSQDNISYSLPNNPTTTVTISTTIQGDTDQVKSTTEHEVGHAHDARTNTNQYGHDSQKTKETNGKTPHDERPEEKRANDFKHTVQQEVKQYQKEHKHGNDN